MADQLRMDFQTAQLLTEEHRSAPLPIFTNYVPPSIYRLLDEEQQHINLPNAMTYSPVSSDSQEEPTSDGQLEAMMLRKNVLQILICEICRRTPGVSRTTPYDAPLKNYFFYGNGEYIYTYSSDLIFLRHW